MGFHVSLGECMCYCGVAGVGFGCRDSFFPLHQNKLQQDPCWCGMGGGGDWILRMCFQSPKLYTLRPPSEFLKVKG